MKFAERRGYTDLAHINKNEWKKKSSIADGSTAIGFVAMPRLVFSSLRLTGLKTSGIHE